MGFSFGPDGKVMHAQVRIGDSFLMFGDEYPEWNSPSPSTTKADTCVRLHLYVEDIDRVFESAAQGLTRVRIEVRDETARRRWNAVRPKRAENT